MKYQNTQTLMTCIMAASLALGGVAGAASVLIQNPSFEDPVVSDNNSVLAPKPSGTFNNWSYTMTTGSQFQDFGIENPAGTAYTGAGADGTPAGALGSNVIFLNQGIPGGTINIFQDVGALAPNTLYTLVVSIGQRLDRVNGAPVIALINGVAGETDAWINGTILNSTTGVSAVAGSFQDFTVTFTTGATVSSELYIGAQYTGDPTIQASLDNFRLDASPIPEPAAACLALLGGVGMLRRRRN